MSHLTRRDRLNLGDVTGDDHPRATATQEAALQDEYDEFHEHADRAGMDDDDREKILMGPFARHADESDPASLATARRGLRKLNGKIRASRDDIEPDPGPKAA